MADAYLTEVEVEEISKSGWSGAGWQTAEIATAHSITGPAVLEIQCANARTGTSETAILGVRKDSGVLERKLELDRAKTGGSRVFQMFVQMDDSGNIELYDDNVDDSFNYYISGYWTNVSFTEEWHVIDTGAADTWVEHMVNPKYGGRIAHCLYRNYDNINGRVGSRTPGSANDRRINMTNNYSQDGRCVVISKCTTLGQYGAIETNLEKSPSEEDVVIAGYFGSALRYVETVAHDGGFSITANVWETEDLSDQWLTGDSDATILAADLGLWTVYDSVDTLGLRNADSSQERKLAICPRESSQKHGINMHTTLNSSGAYGHVSSLDPNYHSWILGYFITGAAEDLGSGGVIQPLVGGNHDTCADNTTEYSNISCTKGWTSTRTSVEQVVATNGIFSSLFIDNYRGTDLTGADECEFAIYINGVKSDLTATITAGVNQQISNISDTVRASAGDLVCIGYTSTSDGGTSRTRWSTLFTPDDGESTLWLGGYPNNLHTSTTEYNVLNGGVPWGSGAGQHMLRYFPTDGTVQNLHVSLTAIPGFDNSFLFSICKNGTTPSDVACTIDGSNLTGNSGSESIAVVAGDYIVLQRDPTGGPAVGHAKWGCTFIPTIPGETVISNGFNNYNDGDDPDVDSIDWASITQGHHQAWGDTSTTDISLTPAGTVVKKLHWYVETAPGSGNSYDFGIYYDNSGGGLTDTGVGVIISGSETSETDLVNTYTVSEWDELTLRSSPTSTPTKTDDINVCWVAYYEPVPPFSTETKTFTADAVLTDADTYEKEFTADAVLWHTFQTKTLTADALLVETQTKTFTANTFLIPIPKFQDLFTDNDRDIYKWEETEFGGLTVTETNSELQFVTSGSQGGGGYVTMAVADLSGNWSIEVEITAFWTYNGVWKEFWIQVADERILSSNPAFDTDDFYAWGLTDDGVSGVDNANLSLREAIGSEGYTPHEYSSGDNAHSEGKLRLERIGSKIYCYFDGVLKYSQDWNLNSDTAKYIYIWGYSNSSSNQMDIDNFEFAEILTDTFTADAVLTDVDTYEKEFTADALLVETQTKTFTADVLLTQARYATFEGGTLATGDSGLGYKGTGTGDSGSNSLESSTPLIG